MKKFLTFVAWLGLTAGPLWAVSSQITFQGTLKENGVPVTATQNMQFSFVDATGATIPGTVPIPMANVQVTNGLFAVQLPIDPAINWQGITPFIQVSVQGQILSPNQPLTSNLYAIVSQTVVNNAIGTAQLQNNAVTTAQIAPQAVTTAQIADGAVTTGQVAPAAITTSQIANNAVTTAQIAAASVATAQIAPQAVTTALLANAAVTTAQIANGAVTTPQLANASVTTSQIADGSVTLSKLDPSVQGITIPSGLIALFSGPCPNGWSRFAALDNAFPMGGPTYGTTGGSATHTHTLGPPTAVANNQWLFGNYQGSGSHEDNFALATHVHNVSTASNIPPFVTMVYCVKS